MTEQIPHGQPQPDGREPKEPTHEQLSTARVLSFLTAEEIIKKRARKYHGWTERHGFGKEERQRLKNYRAVKQTTEAVIDLYVLKENHLSLDKFNTKWEERTKDFERLLNEVKPQIDEQNRIIEHLTPYISAGDRKEITKAALGKLANRNHRKNLLSMEGLTEEERKKQRGKFLIATGLSIGTAFLAQALVGAGIALEYSHPLVPFGPIYDWKTFLALTGATGYHYGSIWVNKWVINKLHEDPDINTGPSLPAKVIHHTRTELLPENPDQTDRAELLAIAFPSLVQEPAWLAGAIALPVIGPLVATGRALGSGALHNLEAIAGLTALAAAATKREVGRRRERRERRG